MYIRVCVYDGSRTRGDYDDRGGWVDRGVGVRGLGEPFRRVQGDRSISAIDHRCKFVFRTCRVVFCHGLNWRNGTNWTKHTAMASQGSVELEFRRPSPTEGGSFRQTRKSRRVQRTGSNKSQSKHTIQTIGTIAERLRRTHRRLASNREDNRLVWMKISRNHRLFNYATSVFRP